MLFLALRPFDVKVYIHHMVKGGCPYVMSDIYLIMRFWVSKDELLQWWYEELI